jgi:ectoine hydroxylase-related dioxygenase (phytanoyl-CoA dioxygenase family)
MKLNSQQVEQFRRDGYLKIPHRLIEDDHLKVLRKHYDALFAQKRGAIGQGLRNLAVVGASENQADADRSEEMLQIMEMWRYDAVYRELLYHASLLDIVESLIGPNIQLFHDQALYKPAHHGGPVPWHQDNGYWRCEPPELVSIWIALDDADEGNGCMNVIPGSHLEIAPSHSRAYSEKGALPALLEAKVDESRATPVPVKAGYGMAHHCLTLHHTKPNTSARDRRAMVIHYMPAGTRNGKGEVMRDHLMLRGKFPD